MKDILPNRSIKDHAMHNDGIVVHLHGLNKKDNKLVERQPFVCKSEQINAEELEYKVAKYLHISNFALPLFGLNRRQQDHIDWLLPSTTIKPGEVLWFSLRLAFVDQKKLAYIAKHCDATIDYIYGQVREGFLNKQWDLGQIEAPDYARIIIADLQCHGYLLGLRAAELKKALNFDHFAGPYYNGISKIIDKATLKTHCMKQCSLKDYLIQDNASEIKQEQIEKEIRNSKYLYVSDILKNVTQFGSTYKSQDGKNLIIVSKVQEDHQGLGLLTMAGQESSRLTEVSSIFLIDVNGRDLEITSFDNTRALQKEVFAMKREEDAISIGLLINLLYKLSVNYTTDLWSDAQKKQHQLFQKHSCHPPLSRQSWATKRLRAVNQIQDKYKYIISEDFKFSGTLNVLCLDLQKSSGKTILLVVKRYGSDDVWCIEEHQKFFTLETLNSTIAEIVGYDADSIGPVPLLLPYNEEIYHCRKNVETAHQPILLNQYTISSYCNWNKNTSVYAAKANFRRTAKSRAEDIAIKRLENLELQKVFTDMICQMTHWNHENLICLHGVSCANGVEMIVDYFHHGHLRNFMNYSSANLPMKVLHLVKITEQLLRALVYLQERVTLVEKEPGDLGSYHGNIKMSKLMVESYSEDDIRIKLGDPGLHENSSTSWLNNPEVLKILPWCAPELMDGPCTRSSFTDIFSLGVTIWEIWSFGVLPFKELNHKNKIIDCNKVKLIKDYVTEGGRLTKPHDVSPALYELMMDCWKAEPLSRPSIQAIQSRFYIFLMSVDLSESCHLREQTENTFNHDKVDWASFEEEVPDEIQQNIANIQEEAAAGGRTPSIPDLLTGPSTARDVTKRGKQISSINIHFLDKTLGKGSFGTVKEGILDYQDEKKRRKVAVKACLSNNDENAEALKNEIDIMSQLEHENVVKIEGYILEKGSWHLVMEYMAGGSLREYVRASPDEQFDKLALLAKDTAQGMAYLRNMNVIHKDLAARNVLLTSNRSSRPVAKISDFGLSRVLQAGCEYKLKQKKSPWKWYPPEALEHAIFTAESDVWSYGCVVWEIFDGCKHDLALVEGKHIQVEHRDKLRDGHRKEKPSKCPMEVYEKVILKCWEHSCSERPTFLQLVDIWNDIVS